MIRHARRAFTLVELLVASAIMVILVLVVVKVANDTLAAYDRVVADLSAQTEARAVLDNLERDLNSAVIRPDGRCWMEVIVPGAAAAPTGFAAGMRAPNIPADLQPVLLFFASPPDRPRFQPGLATRDTTTGARINEIRGDVCAIAYRMGMRSPFDVPGDPVQQVYVVQRTVLDAQSTFSGALTNPALPAPQVAISATIPPSTFWNGTRNVADYTLGLRQDKALFDGTLQGGWTMDEANFCAQNVVAMSLTLWCASSQTRAQDNTANPGRAAYGSGLTPDALRPLTIEASDAARSGTSVSSGSGVASAYGGLYSPNERYTSRARIYSDRIFLDARTTSLPYTLRQVEVSVTVLTPQGSRELRGLQLGNNTVIIPESTTSQFRRIVSQHGRSYSRRIQVLGTGG